MLKATKSSDAICITVGIHLRHHNCNIYTADQHEHTAVTVNIHRHKRLRALEVAIQSQAAAAYVRYSYLWLSFDSPIAVSLVLLRIQASKRRCTRYTGIT